MGPVKQLAVIPFNGGLDTKSDPRLVAPGNLLQAQNVIFKQTGAINRRWGYTALSTQKLINSGESNVSSATQLATYGNELLLTDSVIGNGGTTWGYNARLQRLVNRGAVFNVVQTNQSITRNASQQLSPDFGFYGGIDVYAWEDSFDGTSANGVRYSVFDTATGTALLINSAVYSTSTLTTDIRPKVIAYPSIGKVVIFWMGADLNVYAVAIDPANPATVAATPTKVTTSAALSTAFYDVACSADGTTMVLFGSGASFVPTYIQVTAGLVAGTTGTVAGAATKSNTGCLSIVFEPTGAAFWLVYADNGTASVSTSIVRFPSVGGTRSFVPVQNMVDSNQIQTVTSTVIVLGTTPQCFTYAEVIQAATNNVTNNYIRSSVCDNLGNLQWTKSTVEIVMRGCGLASKAFAIASSPYINIAFQSPLQSTYFTVQPYVGSGAVVAKSLAGTGGGLVASSDYILPECPQIVPNVFRYASLVKGQPNTTSNGIISLLGVNATTLNFNAQGITSTSIARNLVTTGGIVQSYDGQQFVEQNFHIYPEGIGLSAGGSSGHLSAGVYNYAVVWTWTDATGQIQYSTPSVVQSVTASATNSVTLTIPNLRITAKSVYQIRIYRTQVNGLTLSLVTNVTAPVFGATTTDTTTYIDGASDATIAPQEAMYTQPLVTSPLPVLVNSGPPACTMSTVFDGRLFISGLDDPLQYWYSQQVLENIPIQFSTFLTGSIDPDGGAITALARMDDKLVFFKSTAIFFISGTGVDATGQGTGYSQPEFLPSGGVGCVNAASVVLVPNGLIFQSANGWYLLDRGLNVTYIGASVEFYNGLTVTSATLIPNQWVVWTTTSGTAIVYDYFHQQWTTFTNHAAVAAVLFGGIYYWARADGTVFQQTPNGFTDNGVVIGINILTAKIALAQIQGYQRIYEAYLIGSYRGPGVTLALGCAYDNQAKINAMALVPVDNALGISLLSSGLFGTEPWTGTDGSTVLQLRFDICKKCESIQFQITDSQNNPGNEGFSLSAITLSVGVKEGGFKGLPASKQFGVT